MINFPMIIVGITTPRFNDHHWLTPYSYSESFKLTQAINHNNN